MSTNIATDTAPPGKNQRRSKWLEALVRVAGRFWLGRYKYFPAIGYVILLGIFWTASARLSSGNAVSMWSPPSETHIFGVDATGSDVLQVSLANGAKTMSAGILAAFLGVGMAVLTGWWVALSSRTGIGFLWLDRISRCTGFLPGLVVLLLIFTAFEPGFWKTVFLLSSIVLFATLARIGEWFEELEDRGDTISATVLGLTRSQIIRGNHLSFVAKRGIALACGLVPGLVLGETALSYVGFGIGTGTWGSMLGEAREVIFEAPWLSIYPGFVATLSLMALALLGWSARKSMDGEIPPRVF